MLQVNNIKLHIEQDVSELPKLITKKLGINSAELKSFRILKRSIDARDKNNILYIYAVIIEVSNEQRVLKKKSNDVISYKENKYSFKPSGTTKLSTRPVIIGSGPAGLFCAYNLALYGYRPIIIERGEQVENRVDTINHFFKTNQLNTESNVQFGEGGAGTFSDGKLNTLIKDTDGRIRYIYESFVRFGAPEEILWQNKPHIGTDYLRTVVSNMRKAIIELGGNYVFNTCMNDLIINGEQITGIRTAGGTDFDCEVLVTAIGHSARDTFKMLYEHGLNMIQKPFAIGVRVEHLQETISKSQYGNSYTKLPPADYKLTYKASNGRGVYSFCMCPGGYVVNASSEEGRLAVNGMSNYRRDSQNANSAIAVTVDERDFDCASPLAGIELQRRYESFAYSAGDGSIPVQRLIDYKNNKATTAFGSIKPCNNGLSVPAKLNNCLSEDINNALLEAMDKFSHTINGFGDDDVLLSGVETRTSSPVRIIRDDNMESNVRGIYPCGEGAGYAGGITSSAVDGLRVSEAIMNKYMPTD